MHIETKRQCRICKCSEGDRCFEIAQHPLTGKQALRRYCDWVGPDLCSFCAADGGPKHLQMDQSPEAFSGLLDRYGEPLRWSKDLPK